MLQSPVLGNPLLTWRKSNPSAGTAQNANAGIHPRHIPLKPSLPCISWRRIVSAAHHVAILRPRSLRRFDLGGKHEIGRYGLIRLKRTSVWHRHACRGERVAGSLLIASNPNEFRRRRDQPPTTRDDAPRGLQENAVELRRN